MLKLLNTNHIHTVQDFVFRSHNLTKVMADKVVDIINYHALQSYKRSLQDNARKNAFMEANVQFEFLPDDINYHPNIKGVQMPQSSIKMCKKKHSMMEMNGNEKQNELRKVLNHIHNRNLMKEVFLFENNNDGYGWMEYVMKVFQKNDIDSIAILVRRSHELVDKIPNDALKIIMNHAITLHERNVREAARKIAFKEADIPFEILPEKSSQFVFINKQRAYRTYTVMKKNRKKTNTMTERTLEEKLRRLGVDIDAARKDANFMVDEVVKHDEEGNNKVIESEDVNASKLQPLEYLTQEEKEDKEDKNENDSNTSEMDKSMSETGISEGDETKNVTIKAKVEIDQKDEKNQDSSRKKKHQDLRYFARNR